MTRIFSRRRGEIKLLLGTDRVLTGMSLPIGTIINNIRGEITLLGTPAALHRLDIVAYAMELWLIPVGDPDAGTAMNTTVDGRVPKDSDSLVMDLDIGATDATPFWEPGEVAWSQVFDVGYTPEMLYHRDEFLTYASGAVHKFQDGVTPFANEWMAGLKFNYGVKRRLRVTQPSILVAIVASPNLDETDPTEPTQMAETEWPRIQYIESMLEQSLIHLLGLTETGAETPWIEAPASILAHVEPDMFEEDAGAFVAQEYRAFGEMIVDHTVEGKMGGITITGGRN